MIFVISTLAGAQVPEIAHKLDRLDPFDHLESQLVLAAQSEWSAMQKVERLSVHLIGKDGQLMAHVSHGVNIVVNAALRPFRE